MSAFDKVIGYETIKNELMQVCDMIHNREKYKKVGANLPKGLLLDGDPGLGKTLMVSCFIKEAGLKTYTIRRDKGEQFTESITATFEEAKNNAPSIVFLDDMDKFANEDDNHRDAEEYVAVQSGIDSVKDFDVFVIGTVNNSWKLPSSLTRAGRFDRYIKVRRPTGSDSDAIIRYYLSNKKLDDTVNFDDLTRMINYESCAELETLMNEAAILAVSNNKTVVGMVDLVNAILRSQYDSPDDYSTVSKDNLTSIAYHEAGHLVVSEIIKPGSVGFASIRSRGRSNTGGFIHRCLDYDNITDHVMVSLAGKVSTDTFTDLPSLGSGRDINNAYKTITTLVTAEGINGNELFIPDWDYISEISKVNVESMVRTEVSKYTDRVRKILISNRAFVEAIVAELMEKKTLLYSDIQRIRKSVG